jgi:DNA-binding FadR family transcriptional regulator
MTTAPESGEVRKPRLIDGVAMRLRQRILAGEWPVGARIPTEPELTQLIGVGRNTIREAVQSLVHAGLLERRQGSGTYVVSTSELAAVMNRQLAEAAQRDVLEVRQALEVSAVALAAQRRTDHDAAQLRVLTAARAEAVAAGDLQRMVSSDMTLHRFIASCAKNPVLAELYDNVLGAVRSNIRFNFQQIVADGDSHEVIVGAIIAGDAATAAREIEVYLRGMADLIGPEEAA